MRLEQPTLFAAGLLLVLAFALAVFLVKRHRRRKRNRWRRYFKQ